MGVGLMRCHGGPVFSLEPGSGNRGLGPSYGVAQWFNNTRADSGGAECSPWLLGRRRPCHDALSRDPVAERAGQIREKMHACSQGLPTFSFKHTHSKQKNLLRDAMSLSVNLVVCQDGVFE